RPGRFLPRPWRPRRPSSTPWRPRRSWPAAAGRPPPAPPFPPCRAGAPPPPRAAARSRPAGAWRWGPSPLPVLLDPLRVHHTAHPGAGARTGRATVGTGRARPAAGLVVGRGLAVERRAGLLGDGHQLLVRRLDLLGVGAAQRGAQLAQGLVDLVT